MRINWQATKILLFVISFALTYGQENKKMELKIQVSENDTVVEFFVNDSIKLNINSNNGTKLYVDGGINISQPDKKIKVGPFGIYVKDSVNKIEISLSGIYIDDNKAQIEISKKGIIINEKDGDKLEITPLTPEEKSKTSPTNNTKKQIKTSNAKNEQKPETPPSPPEEKDKKKEKKRKKFSKFESFFALEVGANQFISSEGIGIPEEYDSLLKLNVASLHNSFTIHNVYYITPKFAVDVGIGIDVNRASLNSNYIWGRDSNKVFVEKYENPNVLTNRFKVTSFKIPVSLYFDISDKVHLALGGYAALIVDNKHKIKYVNESNTLKAKVKGDFNLNKIRYGVRASITLDNNFGIYFNYDLSPFFAANSTDNNFNLFSVGVEFSLDRD